MSFKTSSNLVSITCKRLRSRSTRPPPFTPSSTASRFQYFASKTPRSTSSPTASSTSDILERLRRDHQTNFSDPDDGMTTGSSAGVRKDGRGGVGPFPMGVGGGMGTPMGMGLGAGARTKRWKSWSDLGFGGKIKRSVAQTGNLTVILVGGTLFLVLTYALTSELFATNSPTVLQNRAIDLISSSSAIKPLLLPPYAFTHSPSATATSSRGTPVIQHQLIRHPSTGHEHLVMRFWVHGRGIDEPRGWRGWLADGWEQGNELGKEGLLWAGIMPVVEEQDDEAVSGMTSSVSTESNSSGPGWFSGLFGALSTSAGGRSRAGLQSLGNNKRKELPPAGTYKMGEVKADYVKDPETEKYKLLTLTIDVPNGVNPAHRAVIFWGETVEVSHEGVLEGSMGRMRW